MYRIMSRTRVQEVNAKKSSDNASGEASPRRRYDSTRRRQQAAQTRADVLDAAVRLFAANGWKGTTLPLIAAEAGVAVETIYSGFGSKRDLLRAAVDAAITGDQLPIPFVERDDFRRFAEGERSDRIRWMSSIATRIQVRSHGVWAAVTEAAASDDEVERWRIEMEANRHLDVGRVLEQILGTPPRPTLHDLAWVLLGPDTYRALTADRGFTPDRVEDWLTEVLETVLPVS